MDRLEKWGHVWLSLRDVKFDEWPFAEHSGACYLSAKRIEFHDIVTAM